MPKVGFKFKRMDCPRCQRNLSIRIISHLIVWRWHDPCGFVSRNKVQHEIKLAMGLRNR